MHIILFYRKKYIDFSIKQNYDLRVGKTTRRNSPKEQAQSAYFSYSTIYAERKQEQI